VWYKKFDESTKREYFELDCYKLKASGELEGEKNPKAARPELEEKVKK